MTGVYESGPGWFSSHTDFSDGHNRQMEGWGFQDTTEGEGLMGLRRGRGRREKLEGEEERETVWQLFLKLLFQPFSCPALSHTHTHPHTHTHTGFPCFMGLSIYMMIFIMYILYILPPNPKMTPKHNSQKSLCICSMISVFLMGTKQKCPHKIKNFWYYYPFGDIMSPQHRAYLNHTHLK